MPIYVYKCPLCGKEYSDLYAINKEPETINCTNEECKKKGIKAKKKITKSNFILTGTGFYKTDYKGKK